MRIFTIILLVLLLSPAAYARDEVSIEIVGSHQNKNSHVDRDPAETFNRTIHRFNETVDGILLQPAAKTYQTIVPRWGRERVGSFFTNLSEPVTFLNAVLQGDVDHAFTTFWRFFINTTVGRGGLYDEAEAVGLAHRSEDFGQTMGSYRVGSGPYIVLPILGPSSLRDTVGLVVDTITNPFSYLNSPLLIARVATEGVHDRSELLDLTAEIERTSFDPYATYRSAYTQRRASQVNNGKPNGKR